VINLLGNKSIKEACTPQKSPSHLASAHSRSADKLTRNSLFSQPSTLKKSASTAKKDKKEQTTATRSAPRERSGAKDVSKAEESCTLAKGVLETDVPNLDVKIKRPAIAVKEEMKSPKQKVDLAK
jgi:hypothetical protein